MDASLPTTSKMHKLETCESLAMLQGPLVDRRSSDTSMAAATVPGLPAIGLFLKRGRLLLFTTIAVVAVVALTLSFSGRGVVIETFNRRDKSTKDQEDLLEQYNAYSGTITAAIERPLEIFAAVAVQVIVLRLMADDVLRVETHWRVGATVVALGTGTMYLLGNGLSAVNVQVRDQQIQYVITDDDLLPPTTELAKTSTVHKTFPENQPGNPATNTILRNLLVPRVVEPRQVCGEAFTMTGMDDVTYRLPQRTWMKSFLPTAREPKSMTITIAKTNTPQNAALSPAQFPMNASVAADLLVYSSFEGASINLANPDLRGQVFNQSRLDPSSNRTSPYAPTARLTGMLPPAGTSEQDDREWFLKHSGPIIYNTSSEDARNASLRSWAMTFSRVNIQKDSVWVDAVTIEREMATPRLQPNTSKDGKTGYFPMDFLSTNYVQLRRAGGAQNEAVEMFGVCADRDGHEILLTNGDSGNHNIDCTTLSNNSLLVVTRDMRLVADAFMANTTLGKNGLEASKDKAVVVNLREISSVTVARINWKLQDLSEVFGARCDVAEGCMGLSMPLADGGQQLVVSAQALPVKMVSKSIEQTLVRRKPVSIVSVQRPISYGGYRGADFSDLIGDVVLPHNIGKSDVNKSSRNDECVDPTIDRLNVYFNNHIYIEYTLQTAYTAAGLYLFQSAITRDILNQSTTATQTRLAFQGNVQDVDVYVYIPSLNVMITLAGCGLLVLVVAVVLLWPQVGLGGKADPLTHITTPQTIAKILLDGTTFPPLLVTRSVKTSMETTDANRVDNAGEYFIQEIQLEQMTSQMKDESNETSSGSGTRQTIGVDV